MCILVDEEQELCNSILELEKQVGQLVSRSDATVVSQVTENIWFGDQRTKTVAAMQSVNDRCVEGGKEVKTGINNKPAVTAIAPFFLNKLARDQHSIAVHGFDWQLWRLRFQFTAEPRSTLRCGWTLVK
jgi:hypothetical protein